MKVIVERGRVVSFEDLPPKSIALDGYVQGPMLDPKTERYSFDHHDKCIRLVTSATCKQVLDALLLGMDPSEYSIFVNDVDEDTILSVWLLENVSRVNEPKVRWLVDRESERDAHGPAFPIQDTECLLFQRFTEAVNEPIREYKGKGVHPTDDLSALLRECVDVIDRVLIESGNSIAHSQPDRTYQIFKVGRGGWVMVESSDKVADLLYVAGYTKIILYQQLGNGSYNYTIMKKSDLVPGFPVGPQSEEGTILQKFATIEEGWGGGSTIGGAPRHLDGMRSSLPPDQVFEIVEALLEELSA